MQEKLAGLDVGRVAVGFSPPDALAALAEHISWSGLMLSDVDRRLYAALGLGRAPLWRVYSAGTLMRYAKAVARGHRLTRPVEDTQQLGGDAVAVDGMVVCRWRPRSPDDRVDPDELAEVASDYARGRS